MSESLGTAMPVEQARVRELIARRGTEYCSVSLGHCSCYGPGDHAGFTAGASLNDLLASMSADMIQRTAPLVAAIKESRP